MFVFISLSTILYRIRNKISRMEKYVAVIQEMVSIYSGVSINNTVIASDWCDSKLTQCWPASI